MSHYHSEVVADYADALRRDLTFNSKPHINNLTTIAKENMEHAKELASVIAERIRTAPSLEKLPSLYLLDSIVKNVGGVFTVEFGKNIVDTFCLAYDAIKDNVEQRNMYLRLLKTWVGPQYFPPQAISEIERRVTPSTPFAHHASDSHGRPIHVNPRFFQPSRHNEQQPMPGAYTNVYPPQQQQPMMGMPVQQNIGRGRQPLIGAYPTHPVNGAMNMRGIVNTPPMHMGLTMPQQQQQQSTPLNPYQRTLTPPLVAPSQYPQPLLKPVQQIPPQQQQQQPLVPTRQNPYQQQSYIAPRTASPPLIGAIVNTPPPTATGTASGPANDLPRGVYELYDAFPLQCSTCGLRFRQKEQLNSHLDKHYQISSLKASHKVLSRKWYQSEPDWVKEIDNEVMEDPGAIFFKQMDEEKKAKSGDHATYDGSLATSSGMSSTTLNAADLLDNESCIDLVVANDQTRCPLCKDEFESKFDDDIQEWVLSDAVKDRNTGLIAHRICLPILLSQINNSAQQHSSPLKRERDESDIAVHDSPPLKRIKS